MLHAISAHHAHQTFFVDLPEKILKRGQRRVHKEDGWRVPDSEESGRTKVSLPPLYWYRVFYFRQNLQNEFAKFIWYRRSTNVVQVWLFQRVGKKKPCRLLETCFHYFYDNEDTKKAIESVAKSADFHDDAFGERRKMTGHERFLVILLGLSATLNADLVYQANDIHSGQAAADNAKSPYPSMVLFHDRRQLESYNKIAVLYFIAFMDFNFHAVDLTWFSK